MDVWVPLKVNKIVHKLNEYQLLQKSPLLREVCQLYASLLGY